jgi:acylpyruvate hydrolase
MKILSYTAMGERPRARRLGILINNNGTGDTIGDVRAGYARLLAESGDTQAEDVAQLRIGPESTALLTAGPAAMEAARAGAAYLEKQAAHLDARGLNDELLFTPLADAVLFAPLNPSKVIAAGRNYRAHHAEMSDSPQPFALPTTWFKGSSAIVGPHDDIVKPAACKMMDYETEMAFVIGTRCKNVPAEHAMDMVAGYTIANDVTARDIGKVERLEGNRLLGKSFDGFCPMGPCFVTADEITDPNNLNIRTRVNGDIRQDANTEEMIWKIPQIISYISQIELLPGDVVLTGSPAGVASGKDGGENKLLKPGDVLESEVIGIGTMRNHIIEDPLPPSWQWKHNT